MLFVGRVLCACCAYAVRIAKKSSVFEIPSFPNTDLVAESELKSGRQFLEWDD